MSQRDNSDKPEKEKSVAELELEVANLFNKVVQKTADLKLQFQPCQCFPLM